MTQFAVNILGMEVDVVPLALVLGLDHEIIIGAHEISSPFFWFGASSRSPSASAISA